MTRLSFRVVWLPLRCGGVSVSLELPFHPHRPPLQAAVVLPACSVPVPLQEESAFGRGWKMFGAEIIATFQGHHQCIQTSSVEPHTIPEMFIKLHLQSLLHVISHTEHYKKPNDVSIAK